MAFNSDITPGAPPLLWSDVHEAFIKVNENFDILVATIGNGSGLTPLNFETLDTSVSPSADQTYQLGDQLHRWKSVHTGVWSEVPGSELNGLWAGAAHIKGYQSVDENNNSIWIVDLPLGSKVNGNLIIDPDKTFFKSAQVDNELRIEANEFSDTLNLLSGNGIQLLVDSSSESIEFINNGVLSVLSGNGIIVNSTTGNITITNDGVRSLQSTTALPSGRATGAGINISATKGDNVRITNTGVLNLTAGNSAINISSDPATGIFDISYVAGVLAPVSGFTTITISGDLSENSLQSDSTADTLTFAPGYGIILTNNPTTDTMTIALNQRIDIIGSVFGDNSTKIVDAVENKVYADFFGNLTGNVVGNVTGNLLGGVTGNVTGNVFGDVKGSVFADDSSLLVDGVGGILPAARVSGTFVTISTDDKVRINGNTSTLQGLIFGTQSEISSVLGQISSLNGILFAPPYGGNPIPGPNPSIQSQINFLNLQLPNLYNTLGTYSFYLSDPSGEISYNAETAEIRMDKTLSVPRILSFLTGDVKGSVFGDDSSILVDSVSGVLRGTLIGNVTGNVNGTVTGNVFTTLIDSADSSAITVTPAVVFSSQVNVEGTLSVNDGITGYISLNDLKSVVAASSSFADFQTRIAALV
jgi:hypothetical protein